MIALPRNPKPMDKTGEKALYRQFILATPEDSYLRTVLMDSQSFVFGNIDNDIAWPVYERSRLLDRDIDKSKGELRQLKAQIELAKRQLEDAQIEVKYAKRELTDVLDKTQRFLNQIDEANHVLRHTLNKVQS